MEDWQGFQIYDDVSGPPPSPEAMQRIKEWFDEMVESGRIKVLTHYYEGGSVTIISKGDALADETEID